MNSLNRHDLATRIGFPALSVHLLLSLSPSATAHAAPIQPVFSRSNALHLPWGASQPWPRMHSASAVDAADTVFGPEEAVAMTLTLPTEDALEPGSLRAGTSPSEAAAALGSSLVIQSTGAIEADLERFRALLGNPNNGVVPGQQLSGRREINWDAVPAAVTNVSNFPNAFFNTNSPRGLVYDDVSRGLQVSDRSFTDINPTYAAEFLPFSGTKVFSPRGSNESRVQFFVAGSNTKALVRGFGVVFVDVDTVGTSGIEVIGANGEILERIIAPVRSDARGASFVGIVYRNPVISRARIVTGDGRLAPQELDISQGGLHDLVVMDDFLYGEPTATHN